MVRKVSVTSGQATAVGLIGLAAIATLAVFAAPADGSFVAVGGYVAGTGSISWSANGLAPWNPVDPGTSAALRGVDHDGEQWIAVGDGGTILSSTDMASWTPICPGAAGCPAGNLNGVAAMNGLWVAVGDGGTIITSSDGETWAPQMSPTTNILRGVASDGTKWIAVGWMGTIVVGSADGTLWTPGTFMNAAKLNDIEYGNGVWVAIGQGLYRSTMGDSGWALEGFSPAGTPMDSVARDIGNTWVGLGGNSAGYWRSTNNGDTWAQIVNPWGGSGAGGAVRYGDGRWIIGGLGGGNSVFHRSASAGAGTWAHEGGTLQPQTIARAGLRCQPNTQTTTVDQATTFTGTGGSTPYTWSAPGALQTTGTGTSFTTTYPIPNPINGYTVTLTDGFGTVKECNVLVNPLPLTCSPATQTAEINQVRTITLSGGTLPRAWNAPGNTGPASGTTSIFNVAYATPGPHNITVTDDGTPPQSTTCRVDAYIPLTCSAPSGPVIAGTPASVTANGGVAPYTWSYPAQVVGVPSGNELSVLFAASGTFTISVEDSGPPIQQDSCDVVSINLPPISAFAFLPQDPKAGEPVTFLDHSTDPNLGQSIEGWWWTFGEGGQSTAAHPTHVFGTPGSFTTCLRVADSWGLASSPRCANVVVSPRPSSEAPPAADVPPSAAPDPPIADPLAINAGADVFTIGGELQLKAVTHGGTVSPAVTWRQVFGEPLETTSDAEILNITVPPGPAATFYFVATATSGRSQATDGVMISRLGAPVDLNLRLEGEPEPALGQVTTLTATVTASARPSIRLIQVEGPAVQLEQEGNSWSYTVPDAPGAHFVFLAEATDGTVSQTSSFSQTASDTRESDSEAQVADPVKVPVDATTRTVPASDEADGLPPWIVPLLVSALLGAAVTFMLIRVLRRRPRKTEPNTWPP